MASRSKSDLHLTLATAFVLTAVKYGKLYPTAPQPFITCTYRSGEEQEELFKQIPKITNARAGKSPHNFNPSFAFDIAFITVAKKIDWAMINFRNFAALITDPAFEFYDRELKTTLKIEWGGSWVQFPDSPHFQLKNWRTFIKK